MAEILSVAGPLIQGVGGFVAGRKNAANLEAQARDEIGSGEAQALLLRDKARRAIGEQVSAQFSNGFQGGTGSALDWLADSQINATLDMLEIRRQAGAKARSLKSSASMARTQGWFDLVGGALGAASAAKGQSNDWAAARAPS